MGMKRGWKPSKTNSKTPDSSLKRLTENTTRLPANWPWLRLTSSAQKRGQRPVSPRSSNSKRSCELSATISSLLRSQRRRLRKRRKPIPNKSEFSPPNTRRLKLVLSSPRGPFRNYRRKSTDLKTNCVLNRNVTRCCKRTWRPHSRTSKTYELVHEKEKFKAISDELDQTFAEMSGY